MEATPVKTENPPSKPISIGLTCWLWEWRRQDTIVRLAQRVGVNLQLTQRYRGLHRRIEGQVSGQNVEQFISEFARHV